MRQLVTLLGKLFLLVMLALALGIAWLAWSNRDLPVAVLEARYGGDGLQQVKIDGVELRYKLEGQGPPVVLLHSHFYTMRMWQPWVDALSEEFTVVRYDLTSHGLTGPDPSEDYSRERGTDLLDGLLKHLNIERTALAGSSTGGALAWYYAARFPNKVNALVLVNAPGMPRVTNKYMEKELPGWFGHLLYLLPESLFRPFLEAPVVDKSLITDELLHEFHSMYRREGNRMAEYHRLLAWERGDIRPTLARITAPTLVMWGEDNPQLPVEHVAQYADALTGAASVNTVIYPDIGHVIPLEIPTESARDTRTFLREALQ
ncbi:alpha/beta hydrolase [Halioglobus maricola]|uniref:Alpha/beta hydrolase n=1 Tax=Halioglobus maricola TaxID=2601894 RepID=A0A5P9NLW0_9GAMM|nr:alpha/beta hydrolase [Halioglobus maricola]QFU76495.1 alpha/beta hydrolase [Halioglobus maricola]